MRVTPLARRHFEAMIVIGSVVTNIGVATLYGMLDHGYQAAALGLLTLQIALCLALALRLPLPVLRLIVADRFAALVALSSAR